MAAGGLADDAGCDLVGAGQLEVEQPQRARLVEPVDVMLDVLGRVLAAHDAGRRVLELAAVRDDRLAHRELAVLACVVDVVVRVEDPAHIVDLDAVLPSWRRIVISFVTIPVIPSVSMISGWLAPVSTRIGSLSRPRIR